MSTTADNVPYKRPSPGAHCSDNQGAESSLCFTWTALGASDGRRYANSGANTNPYHSRSFSRLRDHPMDSEGVSTAYVRGVLSLFNRQGRVGYVDQIAFQGLPISETHHHFISGRNCFNPFPGASDRIRRYLSECDLRFS